MGLPRLDEYQLAVQNPKNAFKDQELQTCRVETNPLGLPSVKTGGFALIYHLSRASDNWAVRCFYREVGDLQFRYDAISRFLEKNADGTFVKASLQIEGIRVGGNLYPILLMPWLSGDVLNLHIERNLAKPNEITWLADDFLRIVNRLEQLGVAHGDLQHGNIMVRSKSLTLIDYDGMYLPELSKSPTKVLGHLNYIHPDRSNAAPTARMDRFPSIVIYLGLKAVAAKPALWRKYSDGENILFQRKDFLDPQSSPLINDLKGIPAVRALAEKFEAICFLDYDKIPSLSEFISPSYVPPKPPARVRPIPTVRKPIEYISQYEVILAEKTNTIVSRTGEMLEIVGQVTNYKRDVTRRNQPYMFLNFGDWRKGAFYLVIWADVLDMMQTGGIRPESFVNKWVSVTGMITEYKGRPQIVVDIPSQIQPLQDKQEALRCVNSQKKAAAPSSTFVDHQQLVCLRHNFRLTYDLQSNRYFCPLCEPGRPQQIVVSRPQHPVDVLSRQQADALQKLYATVPSSPPPIQPSVRPIVASPKVFWTGFLLAVISAILAVAAIPSLLILVILGLVLTYFGAVYRSYPVPVRILSTPWHGTASFGAMNPSKCRGCRQTIRLGESMVKTEIGDMHSRCVHAKKRRVWRKDGRIGLTLLVYRLRNLMSIPQTATITRPKKKSANLLSLLIIAVAFLSTFLMSYPTITSVSTTVNVSTSYFTATSFTTPIQQSVLMASSTTTTCQTNRQNESCRNYILVSRYTTMYASTVSLPYTQTRAITFSKSFSQMVAPYASTGINSSSWIALAALVVVLSIVGAILVRRL